MSENKVHGEFFLDNENRFNFICHTRDGVTFAELKDVFKKALAELNRQMKQQKKCPFYVSTKETL